MKRVCNTKCSLRPLKIQELSQKAFTDAADKFTRTVGDFPAMPLDKAMPEVEIESLNVGVEMAFHSRLRFS